MSAETSSSESSNFKVEKCMAIVVDVAGTTTSINFIKNELFEFVKQHAEEFLKQQWDNDTVKNALKKLNTDEELDVAKAVDLIKRLTYEQNENEGLKTLQGLIYKKAYEDGSLKGHVFPDVAECFEVWSKTKKIAIYSTGSVDSQKLLFSNSVAGDISKYINEYFDQTVGVKTKSESYKNIAKKLQLEPDTLIFITDNLEEAKAAKVGGLMAYLIKREGNADFPEETSKDFTIITTFKDVALDNSTKRKNTDEPLSSEAPPTKISKTEEEDLKDKKQLDVEESKTSASASEEAMDVDNKKIDEKEDKQETATKETEPIKTVTDDKKTEKDTATEEKMDTENIKEDVTEEKEKKTDVKETDKKIDSEICNKEGKEMKTDCKDKKDIIDKIEKDNEVVKDENKKDLIVEKSESTDVKNETKVIENKKDDDVETKKDETISKEKEEIVVNKVNEEKLTEETTTTTTNGKLVPGEKTVNGEGKEENCTVSTTEKENKSVLANGVDKTDTKDETNGINDNQEAETTTTTTNDTNNEEKNDDNEIKVKKIDETTETSKTVSVEV